MRDVKVEFGAGEFTITMREAKEWEAAGLAEWLPRRNRMRFVARRDSKPILRGLSALIGETAVETTDPQVRETFIRNQFLRREMSTSR